MLGDPRKWLEEQAAPLERLLQETPLGGDWDRWNERLKRLPEDAWRQSEEIRGQLVQKTRDWWDDPERIREDAEALQHSVSTEWTRLSQTLKLGDRYRDAIQTLSMLLVRQQIHEQARRFRSPEEHAEKTEALHQEGAEELVQLCRRQGGAWVKAAQFLSTQGDWIPPVYRERLAELQDQAPPASWASIQEVLNAELHTRWPDAFSEIDPAPLATASIAQVHRARLKEGTPVALKVQLPEADERVRADLQFFELAAKLLNDQTPGIDLEQVVRELSASILLELDYFHEAENLQRFHESYRAVEWTFPQLHPDLLSRRTLVMSFIEGKPIRHFLEEVPGAASPLLRTLTQSFVRQIFLTGLFHADPHPGNFFVTPRGQLALLDFGAVGLLSPEQAVAYRNVLVALLNRQQEGFVTLLLQAGFTVPNPEQAEALLFAEAPTDPAQLTRLRRYLQVMKEANVGIPDHFVLVARVLISIGGLLKQHGVKLGPFDLAAMFMQESRS